MWLFYGSKALPEDERPPIPYVPELDDPTWRPVYGEIVFDCPHWSVFENAIDMAHIHYLHSGSFGNQDKPEIRGMTCSTNAYGVEASFRLHNKPVNALWDFSKVRLPPGLSCCAHLAPQPVQEALLRAARCPPNDRRHSFPGAHAHSSTAAAAGLLCLVQAHRR